MLTIFTIPKPFRGHIGVIQNNAIQSWLALRPEPEVILFGNDEGTAEAASRLGARHVADVECNEHGTPLVSSIFGTAGEIASHPMLCYINADIILVSDFLPAIGRVRQKSYLVIGQRWDTDVTEPLDFTRPDWESDLRSRVAMEGKLHPPTGIDYFVFPCGLYGDIPPFAIGRTAWDNWLVYRARKLGAALIDATGAVLAVHQNHDYAHHPQGDEAVWKGPEAVRNQELMGSLDNSFTIEHANRLLTPHGMKRALSLRHCYFQMRAIPVLYPRLRFLLSLFKTFERLVVTLRSLAGTPE